MAAGGGVVRLAVDVGTVVRPSDHGGADQRQLGVVVFRVEFAPLSADAALAGE